MCERDIVERLSPRLPRKSLELVADIIESDEAMGDGKDAAALRVILAAYVAAPEARDEILRLRAELVTARRAGWLAGRDAAADHVCGYCARQNSVCADHIRNMEPLA